MALAVGLAAMSLLWLVSLLINDVSFVDAWWGPGFALMAGTAALVQPPMTGRDVLLIAFVGLWGLRLGLHLFVRWLRMPGEDRRYGEMRAKSPRWFRWRSLASVFWLQAIVAWVVCLPVLMAMGGPVRPLSLLDAAGAAVFAAGFTIEAVADRQLMRFLADPLNRGRVLDTGLWAWSRHPNYFGDASLWWGLYLIALAGGAPWWTAIGPAMMTLFLLKISGVPMLERAMKETRPGYARYAARTSAFIPLPPGRNGG